MDWLFDELALPYDKKTRAQVDSAIRDVLGLGDEAHCPEIWRAVKALSTEECDNFASRIGEAVNTDEARQQSQH